MMNDKAVHPSVKGRRHMDWERYYKLLRMDDAGQSEAALAGLREALASMESADEKAAVLLAIAGCVRNLGRVGEARDALSEVKRIVPKNSHEIARALIIDALLDMDEGKWSWALAKLDDLNSSFSELLRRPEEQDTLADLQRKRGIVLYELHLPSEARTLLERASTLNEERPTVLYYLGRCRYDLGDLEGAKQALRQALALDLHPVYQPSAHYMLGLIHYHQGQPAWAIREYEWCMEHDGRGLVQKPKLLTALVMATRALGMDKEAERYSKMLNAS